jgi:recombinational DNA repair ATPase RecF
MDVSKMVDVLQEKHGITLDPADPVLLLGTLAAELNEESRNEFARIAAQLSAQVAVALVLFLESCLH